MRISPSLVLSFVVLISCGWVTAADREEQTRALFREGDRFSLGAHEPSQGQLVADVIRVDSFAPVGQTVKALGEKHGPERVLLVFDIDSTLLTMNQDLGSDHWFRWQESLPADSEQRVASSFAGLLRVQGLLYAIGGMSVTEPGLAKRLTAWRQQGFQMMALTARGFEFRDATRRELARNNLNFSSNPSFPPSQLSEPVRPFRPATVTALGLPRPTAEKLSQASPRPITFAEGVFMCAGQDKGVMLRSVLAQSQNDVAAIVFVDDGDKNVINMANAFETTSIEMHLFDYTRLDLDAAAFLKSARRQREVMELWNELQASLDRIFPEGNAISNLFAP